MMEIGGGFWPPYPLWTRAVFFIYSIAISAMFLYQKEKSQMKVKVGVVIVPLLSSLPLPALLLQPLHPQGRPALLGPLPGHHGVP